MLLMAMVAVLALTGCKTGRSAAGDPSPQPGYPASMAALGDSITAAYGTCLSFLACPSNSWATGTSVVVDSQYRRILAANPAIHDHERNLAVDGATAAGLLAQAQAAVAAKVDYVTILIGANDACRRTTAQMTTVSTFRNEIDNALAALQRGLGQARILVVSIPDLYRLWEIGHTNPVIRHVWSAGICPSLLVNADSMAASDVDRRRAVRDRIDEYDAALAAACQAYGRRCRYDSGAVHNYQFGLADLSAVDFFHPSAAGQDELARTTYPGTFTW
jgi:lysophospholipase L1-like esterase